MRPELFPFFDSFVFEIVCRRPGLSTVGGDLAVLSNEILGQGRERESVEGRGFAVGRRNVGVECERLTVPLAPAVIRHGSVVSDPKLTPRTQGWIVGVDALSVGATHVMPVL